MNWLSDPSSEGFSPYRDPEPIADFYDDVAQRGTTSLVVAVLVHIALLLILQPTFVLPVPEEEPPRTITVDIVTFEEAEPEPEPLPEPAPAPITPVAPAAVPEVAPEPVPTPPTPPTPPPAPEPEPVPEPEPEPEPVEPVFTPPPEILAQDTPEPADNPVVEPIAPPEIEPEPFTPPEPEPVIEPEPIIEPIPQPMIEIFDQPIDPEPVIEQEPIEPVSEPIPDPVIEPTIEIFDQPIDPEPPTPETEIIEEPLIEPTEDILEPLPGTPDPVLEPLEPVVDTPPVQQEDIDITPPEPVTPEPVEPEVIQAEPAEPVITTAPTVLASPDAPETVDELQRAVPQSQADQMLDPLQRPNGGGGPSNPFISGPSSGGGGAPPPSGGTQRANPGAGGWTLDPSSLGGTGEGYGGMIKDIKCREDNRTHQDCPEYMPKFQGRNAAGYESFGAHSTSGIGGGRTSARAGTYRNPAIGGGNDLWTGSGIGDNSINAGGPSTTVLDDADFGREFLSTPLGDGSQPNRVRDLFSGPKQPTTGIGLDNLILPPDDNDEEED